MLRVLESRGIGLDGVSGEIEVSHLVTPADWAADGMGAGTPFALAHTFAQTGPFRPRNLVRGLDNVVLAGCGTTPGVGIPPVLISGRLAAERVTGGAGGQGAVHHADGPRASIGHDMTAQPSSPVDEPATPERVAAPPSPVLTAASLTDGPAEPARRRSRFGAPPRGPLLTGLAASLLMMIGGFGGGGILLRDPILTNSPLGFWRYGHGHELATALIYLGVALMAWAWIRLGREVLAERVGGRAVLTTAGVWLIPMLVTPPLFTRDVFSYLAQGALPLAGFDPYAVGPEAMPGVFTSNVHYFWQDTPAPYGPLFILLAKTVAWTVGTNIIAGVLLMRLTLVLGLLLLVWALPELTRRLGGRVPVALWVVVANPMMIIHMVGGGLHGRDTRLQPPGPQPFVVLDRPGLRPGSASGTAGSARAGGSPTR